MRRNWKMRVLAVLVALGMVLTTVHQSAFVYAAGDGTTEVSSVAESSASGEEAAAEQVTKAEPEVPAVTEGSTKFRITGGCSTCRRRSSTG